MMRFVALIGLALAASFSCSLDDALANAPCNSNDDCLGAYTCVKTVDNPEVGLCRDDGQCATGQQEGCSTNADGTCDNFLVAVCNLDNPQDCYCCESGTDLVAVDTASGTAACLGNEIENEACDSDAACGTGFVCTRTLEQQAEDATNEPRADDQAEEDGWCRPEGSPACAEGAQPGCRSDSSCGGGQDRDCAENGACFCCDRPEDTTNFNAHVYGSDEVLDSAACVWCDQRQCPESDTCTLRTDSNCDVSAAQGACGCTPVS